MSKFLDLNGLTHYDSKIKEYVDSHGTQVPVITLQISQVVSIEPPAFLLTDEQYDLLLQTNFVKIDCSNVGMDDIVLMFNIQNDYHVYFTHVHTSGIDSIDINKSTKIATLTTLYFASDVEIGIEDEQFIDDTHFYLTELQEQQIHNNSMFYLNSYGAAHDFSYKMFGISDGFVGIGDECLVNLIYDYDDPDTGLGVYHIEEHPIGGGGSSNYNDLTNKPSINGVTLSGNKTTSDLGLFSGDYEDLTNKPTIPTVPTNVSAFTNDAGYLTQHQSLEGYATEDYVDNAVEEKSTVSVSDTGTATDEISYITVDGVEKKIAGGSQDAFIYKFEGSLLDDIDVTDQSTWIVNQKLADLANFLIQHKDDKVIIIEVGSVEPEYHAPVLYEWHVDSEMVHIASIFIAECNSLSVVNIPINNEYVYEGDSIDSAEYHEGIDLQFMLETFFFTSPYASDQEYYDGNTCYMDGMIFVCYNYWENSMVNDGSSEFWEEFSKHFCSIDNGNATFRIFSEANISEREDDGKYLLVYEKKYDVEDPVDYKDSFHFVKSPIPSEPPTEDGTYNLQCTVVDGVPTYSWVQAPIIPTADGESF